LEVITMQTEVRNGRPELKERMLQLREPEPITIRRPEARSGGYVWGALSLIAIWAAVVFAGIFAPDMVTGMSHDHFPLAFVVGALAGLAATGYVVRAMVRGVGGVTRELIYALATLAIWTAVALVSIFVPEMVTGTDPTRLPIAAVIAPIAGAILTRILSEILTVERR
jgi:hypothetical protein